MVMLHSQSCCTFLKPSPLCVLLFSKTGVEPISFGPTKVAKLGNLGLFADERTQGAFGARSRVGTACVGTRWAQSHFTEQCLRLMHRPTQRCCSPSDVQFAVIQLCGTFCHWQVFTSTKCSTSQISCLTSANFFFLLPFFFLNKTHFSLKKNTEVPNYFTVLRANLFVSVCFFFSLHHYPKLRATHLRSSRRWCRLIARAFFILPFFSLPPSFPPRHLSAEQMISASGFSPWPQRPWRMFSLARLVRATC